MNPDVHIHAHVTSFIPSGTVIQHLFAQQFLTQMATSRFISQIPKIIILNFLFSVTTWNFVFTLLLQSMCCIIYFNNVQIKLNFCK